MGCPRCWASAAPLRRLWARVLCAGSAGERWSAVASLLAVGKTRDQRDADARCELRRGPAARVAADTTLAVELLLRPL